MKEANAFVETKMAFQENQTLTDIQISGLILMVDKMIDALTLIASGPNEPCDWDIPTPAGISKNVLNEFGFDVV